MSTELLEKMFADRDTQSNEIPANADSESVVDESVEMDVETTHEEPAFMNESGNEEETDQYADQDNASTQDEPEVEEPEAQSETIDERDAKLASLEKQRADQQSFYQHQINDLKMQIQAKDQVAPEPAKEAMTDEALNDMFWDNPAEAIRLSQQGNQQPQTNVTLQIQEGVQRAMHTDYDEVIASVQHAASLNPQLGQEIWNSPNPAQAAYEKGTQLKEAQLITTDPEAYKAQLRKEIEAEMNSTNNKMPKRVGAARGSSPVHKNNETASEGTSFQNMFSKKRR